MPLLLNLRPPNCRNLTFWQSIATALRLTLSFRKRSCWAPCRSPSADEMALPAYIRPLPCVFCDRMLFAHDSVMRGYGPECAKKYAAKLERPKPEIPDPQLQLFNEGTKT